MRILNLIHDRNILQLDIQKLIDALKGTSNGNVVFQFHCHFVVHEGFEEAMR